MFLNIIGNASSTSGVDTSGITVNYGYGVDSAVLNAQAIEILKQALAKSGNKSATITSTIRTPESQADAMYSNIIDNGLQTQYDTYSTAGDKVLDAYVAAKKAGKTEAQIKQAMVDKIKDLWDQGILVSRHVVSTDAYNKLNVFDVSQNSISNKSEFKTQLDSMKNAGTIREVLVENGCYHIEAPIK